MLYTFFLTFDSLDSIGPSTHSTHIIPGERKNIQRKLFMQLRFKDRKRAGFLNF